MKDFPTPLISAPYRYRIPETPEEYHIAYELAAEIWPYAYDKILTAEQISYMLDWMYSSDALQEETEEGCRFCLLYENDTPIGFCQIGPGKPGELKLHKLYLKADHHGKGLGSMMLQEAIAYAKSKNAKRISLNVNKYNQRAQKAYKRNGFVNHHAECNDIGNNFVMDDFVFSYELA